MKPSPPIIKLELARNKQYVYPDTFAVCGTADESEQIAGAVRNAVLIVEVSSPSTKNYDHNEKFRYSRRVSSVHDYLIVSQDRPEVIHYQRQTDKSIFARYDYADLADIIEVPSVGISLPLARIYRTIEF